MKRQFAHKRLKHYLKIVGPSTLIGLVGIVIGLQFVDPAPPRHLTIATGAFDGAYYGFGEAYSRILKRDGITLEVKSTAGSLENLQLLEAADSGVDVAFIQGGIGASDGATHLISLGSLYYEPLWVLLRSDLEITRLSELTGKRIAVGPVGSGTRVLTLLLLELNGVSAENASLVSIDGNEAADLLESGEVDAAFFVTAPDSPVIQPLLRSKKLRLMSLRRAESYAARLHYLSVLILPEGAIDPAENIPPADVKLIAPTTQLVARPDLHAALIDLILLAATEIHQRGGLFEKTGEFPAPKHLNFELSREAKRFYKSGPSFLQRYLPFWVATFVDRTKVLLLPVLALIFPLFKFMPLVYRWRIRSKIYRWYREIAQVDPDVNPDVLGSHLAQSLQHLNRIEAQVSKISVPLGFTQELYHLRLHIEMLRNRITTADSQTFQSKE